MPDIIYESGTILLNSNSLTAPEIKQCPGFIWDQRTKQFRAEGRAYRNIILKARDLGWSLQDHVRSYDKLTLSLAKPIQPRPHQAAAAEAWLQAGRLGVVCLPTGAGKTILAVLLIAQTQRPTWVVVPTIDLMVQWHGVLEQFFARPIGMIGGGQYDVQDITVSTYDSAVLHGERLGNRFGFMVFDECHHLPADQYQTIARAAIAPFRLGLSATPERRDGKHAVLFELLGGLVYEAEIHEMVEKVLAPYDVINVEVPLLEQDQQAYDENRQIYRDFVKAHGIRLSQPQGWQHFLRSASTLPGGRQAMKAYRLQKRLAQSSQAKLFYLWELLVEHREDQILIFTNDNEFAYRIGRYFFLPVLTHQTKAKERKELLAAYSRGELKVLVTSKVLNEGVDVPEARIGIVLSGGAGVREHVQRLGRILRHVPGKRAVLYEVVSAATNEVFANQRRRQHSAYQGPAEIYTEKR